MDTKRLFRKPVIASAFLFAVLLSVGFAAAELNRWTDWTFEGGPLSAVAVHPTNPSIVVASGLDGLFRSSDGGSTWGRVAGVDDLAGSLFFVRSSPNLVYAATPDEVLRSEDHGASWEKLVTLPPIGTGWSPADLVIDPRDSARLYWRRQSELQMSVDGGRTWSFKPFGSESSGYMRGLEIGLDGTLFAWTEGGAPGSARFLRSTDGATTWQPVAGLGNRSVKSLAVHSESGALVVGLWDPAIWLSLDQGLTWQDVTPSDFSFATAVAWGNGGSAFNPSVMYAYVNMVENLASVINGVILYSSTNMGQTWHEGQVRLPGINELAAVPGHPEQLLVGSPLGLHRSFDSGETWQFLGYGFGRLAAEDIVIGGGGGLLVTQGRNVLGRPAGATQLELLSEISEAHVAAHPTEPDLFAVVSRFRNTVVRDRGTTFETVDMAALLASGFPVVDVVVVGESPATAVVGRRDGQLIRFDETGAESELIVLPELLVRLIQSPHDVEHLVALTEGAVHVSSDAGTSWSAIPGSLPSGKPVDLAVSPADADLWFLATETGLFRSADRGLSWSAVTAPSESVERLTFDPFRPGHLYASTSDQLFQSIDDGASWVGLDIPSDRLAFGTDGRTLYATASDSTRGDSIDEPTGSWSLERHPELTVSGDRFEVSVVWEDFDGRRGIGRVASLDASEPDTADIPLVSADSGVLGFFDEANWEVLIKLLDGRGFNDRFWVFSAAATDVGYTLEVSDTVCGQSKSFVNPVGRPSPAVIDLHAFTDCEDGVQASCLGDDSTLCLGENGRFQVRMSWDDGHEGTGPGRRVRLAEPGLVHSEDSGLFYFFNNDNWELLVKVVDGCDINDHFWVFSAGTTDVEYTLRVEDRQNGAVRLYTNPKGSAAPAVTDTTAFATCDEAPRSQLSP